MISLWSRRNEEHIWKHQVTPEEADEVVVNARPPFPKAVGSEKWSVWGRTSEGRYLQVIFVFAAIDDVEADEYERLRIDQQIALEAGEEAIRIIHARDLTETERRQMRRRNRGRG
jgi:uncharacterized DUF497 family protein